MTVKRVPKTKKVAVVVQPESFTKYDLIKYFNLMRNTFSLDDAKAWSELYCKNNNVNMRQPVRDVTPECMFMYLSNNDVDLPDELIMSIRKVTTVNPPVEIKRTITPKNTTTNDTTLLDAYNVVDMRLDGIHLPLEITATQVGKVVAYANDLKKQITTDYENKAQTKSNVVKYHKVLDGIILECNSKKKPIAKKAVTVKSKAVQARNVKYTKDRINGYSSFTPDTVIGKKKLWTYDTEKQLLTYYVSTTGFTFTGTTLKDYVGEPVVYAVTNPATLPNVHEKVVVYVSTLKTRKLKMSGRFNDNTFILMYQ